MEKRLSIIILLVPFFLFWHWFEPAAKKNRDGIKAYQEKNFDAALNHFLSAKGVKPDSAELKSNMAAALYRKEKYKEALDEFKNIDPEKTGIPASDFYYNMANTCFKQNQFKDALEFYKKSMLADSTDVDAKKNFELTLKKMEEQKK
ncbi:MAG: tetratricopeptide repeat protein, partial [bacterium]|nr:tetratricopeptide repeat protein [bacterium]